MTDLAIPPLHSSSPYGENTAPFPVQSAFDTAVQFLQAGRASLLLRESADSALTVAASVGIDPALVPLIRVPVGEGIAGLVAEHGLAIFGERNGETYISVPVETDGGVEGVLNVTDRLAGHYTAASVPLVTQAARHIGHLLQYERYASRDLLSGLHNRRAFIDMLERSLAMSERTGTPLAIVFLDLDNLKMINDRYGHDQGDEVIRGVGRTIQRILRPYDVAGRYGGDEFALLLTGLHEQPEPTITERIESALDELSREMRTAISTSLGVARWPEDGTTREQLMKTADARMYEQKRRKKTGRSLLAEDMIAGYNPKDS